MPQPPPLMLLDLGPDDHALVLGVVRALGGDGEALAGDDGSPRPLPPRAVAGLVSDLSRDGALDRARALRDAGVGDRVPIAFVVAPDADDGLIAAALALGRVELMAAPLRSALVRARLAGWIDRRDTATAPLHDTEGRRRYEASEERLRIATDAAELGVWVWDVAADQVTWETDRLYTLFGLTREDEAVNAQRFVDEFVHPDDVPQFHRAVEVLQATGRFTLCVRVRPRGGGTLRWVEMHGLQRRPDGPVVGTAVDATALREADAQLRQSEERYRVLFDTVDDGFCILDVAFDAAGHAVDYRFVEVNRAFSAQTGLVDALGRTARELVPGLDQRWFDLYGRVARTGITERFEDEAPAMQRWFDVHASRIGGPGSTCVAVLFRDITARKKADNELRRLAADLSESDRRRTEFLATLAHELRNPLAPLRTGLYMLRQPSVAPAQTARVREMMERQLTHMVRLIDDLMDVARIAGGKIELRRLPTPLDSVIASAVETSAPVIEASGHALAIDLPAEPLPVDVDAVRMAQVFANLLNNAAKYTANGGHLTVTARRDGDMAEVLVSDDGVGIPAAALPSVFDLFTQVGRSVERSQGGLGIGLTLVRRLVEMHGGTVVAESDGPDRGSTFRVRLPLARPALPRPAGVAEAAVVTGAARRVLVVDDNVDAADSLASLLQLDGHQTQVVYDGDEALRLAPAFRPDLVFLDIGMPRRNGYEVARALRSIDGLGSATIVALSGWSAEQDLQRSKAAGFDHHLTKPFSIEQIYRLLAPPGPGAPA